MFRTEALDRLTRVHPVVPPLVFGPAIVGLVALAALRMPVASLALAFFCGWTLWTLAEYWTHRSVFHFEPERGIGQIGPRSGHRVTQQQVPRC